MSAFFRSREVQLTVLVLSFLAVFVPYFLNIPSNHPLNVFSTKLILITSITNAFTLILAVYSQFMRGLHFVRKRSRGYIFKIYMMISIILMLIFWTFGETTGPYHWVMYAIITPLSSVNYSILVFYMASTCARAFRARNLRALMLLATGFIVLLYQAPFTGAVLPSIEPLGLYLGGTFAMAAGRMFLISATVGAMVFGVRVLIGREMQVLGFGREER
ncbi:MAG: hypothetical protein QXH67_00740 [Candidatus Bathyarchaeia archaeon]|nr:hypothetical protein [Candidatus Bathyarchaeota archaeon]